MEVDDYRLRDRIGIEDPAAELTTEAALFVTAERGAHPKIVMAIDPDGGSLGVAGNAVRLCEIAAPYATCQAIRVSFASANMNVSSL